MAAEEKFSLSEKIKEYSSFKFNIKLVDDYGIDGDFIEPRFCIFSYRSILKLPISFPGTTNCNKLCTGGINKILNKSSFSFKYFSISTFTFFFIFKNDWSF